MREDTQDRRQKHGTRISKTLCHEWPHVPFTWSWAEVWDGTGPTVRVMVTNVCFGVSACLVSGETRGAYDWSGADGSDADYLGPLRDSNAERSGRAGVDDSTCILTAGSVGAREDCSSVSNDGVERGRAGDGPAVASKGDGIGDGCLLCTTVSVLRLRCSQDCPTNLGGKRVDDGIGRGSGAGVARAVRSVGLCHKV